MKNLDNREVVSVFTGDGRFIAGLEQSGLEILICHEADKTMLRKLRAAKRQVLAEPAGKNLGQRVLRMAGRQPGEIFLLYSCPEILRPDIAAPPFQYFLRVLTYIQPRFFILDCPAEVLTVSAVNRDGNLANATVFESILPLFSRRSYDVLYGIYNAMSYGCPEAYMRFVLTGARDYDDTKRLYIPEPYACDLRRNADPRVYLGRVLGQMLVQIADSDLSK